MAIQNNYLLSGLYEQLKINPSLLVEIEAYYCQNLNSRADEESPSSIPVLSPNLVKHLRDTVYLPHLFGMHCDQNKIKFGTCSTEKLQSYFTLVRQIEGVQFQEKLSSEESPIVSLPKTVLVESGDPPFEMGKYPVINDEYLPFVKDTNGSPPWGNYPYPSEKGNHPVVFVSWQDATDYCQWLSEKTGEEFKLPTQKQWVLAASPKDGVPKKYPWGDTWDSKNANTIEYVREENQSGNNKTDNTVKENRVPGTTPVGHFSGRDSEWGCADMAGNVWEWCNEDHSNGKWKLLKGGAFNSSREYVEIARSNWEVPTAEYDNIGFRILKVPKTKK